MRPVIGLTCDHRTVDSLAGTSRAHALYTDYTAMVRAAGGVPVVLVPLEGMDLQAVADRIDGLVLTGGGDVDPARYGGTAHGSVYAVDPVRDEFEINLAALAAARRIPTLAICRGMQVLNVALGGTLVEDLASRVEARMEHRRSGADAYTAQHKVELTAGSRVAEALGSAEVDVNTIHHQAVRTTGEGLEACGWSEDGVIESIEHQDASWPMWAVQWHPEWLGPDDEPSQRLFRTFVEAARSATIAG